MLGRRQYERTAFRLGRMLEKELARHHRQEGRAPDRALLFLGKDEDEAQLTPGSGGDQICRPAHVSAARQGETLPRLTL